MYEPDDDEPDDGEVDIEDVAMIAFLGWFVAFITGGVFGAVVTAASLCP